MSINVLILIDHLQGDGTQNAMLRLVTGGAERGFHYHIVNLSTPTDFSPKLEAVASVTHLNYSKYDPRAIWGAWRVIRQSQPDIVQVMLFKAEVMGGILTKFFNIPFLIVHRSGIQLSGYTAYFPLPVAIIFKSMLERLMRGVTHIVIFTESEKRYFQQHGCNNISIIKNGIDADEWSLTDTEKETYRKAIRLELGLSETDVLVTQVGRLSPEKGADILFKAFLQIQIPNIHLALVGDGILRETLERQIQASNKTNHVHLLGYRTDIPSILAATDIFILTSRSEAYPNSILEAWTQALPVIATRTDGPVDMINHEYNGFLVDIEGIAAIANAIEDIVESPKKRQILGENGLNTLKTKYTIQKMRSEFETLYQSLV